MIGKATEQRDPWEGVDMPEDNKGEEEAKLKTILLKKLKEKVSRYEDMNRFNYGEPSIYALSNYSNFRGAISVLTELADEANLDFGCDFNGKNNLSYYQQKVEEAGNKQNKTLEHLKQEQRKENRRFTSENPYVLENKQHKTEQITQISNEGQTSTVTLQPNELNELVRELRSAISLIQENANVITNSKERQKKTEGNNNSNFNEAVDTDKLIEEYEANGCHLTKEMCKRYKEDYDITMNGLRNRLIKAGKWKGRQ